MIYNKCNIKKKFVINDAVDGFIPSTASYYWFVFCQDEILLKITKDDQCEVPEGSDAPVNVSPWNRKHLIATIGSHSCIAVSVDMVDAPKGYVFYSLRKSYNVLPYMLYSIAGKAREILYWDKNTQYCGVCGAPMKIQSAISKRCICCGKEVWPSLAIAIIVLISRDDEVLLVQSRKFKNNYYGLVSGFVETGENLEQCVIREVLEETSLEVENLEYVGSQAWPYPSALMAAFRAKYVKGDLKLQYTELNNGGWFKWYDLPALPQEDSIARKMIDKWVKEQKSL